jgi:hypothetical protein
MRRKLLFGIGLGVFAVLAGLTGEATARAAKKAAAKPRANSQAIDDLKEAHALLNKADRDYDGHRHQAAEEVHKAIEELGYHHKATPAAVPAVTKGEPAVHEAQATSDTQLAKAKDILQGVLPKLKAKHPKAHDNVKAAIAEIDKALAIK